MWLCSCRPIKVPTLSIPKMPTMGMRVSEHDHRTTEKDAWSDISHHLLDHVYAWALVRHLPKEEIHQNP